MLWFWIEICWWDLVGNSHHKVYKYFIFALCSVCWLAENSSTLNSTHLDLSEAFDKVLHHLLVTKRQQYCVSGSALQWFSSYLMNRYQRVVLAGAFSDLLPVTSGVPQCSILGPLLLLVNANDMPRYIQHGFSIALFMDDSKLSALLTLKVLLSLCRQTWTGNTTGALIMAQSSTLPNVKSYSWPGPQPSYQLYLRWLWLVSCLGPLTLKNCALRATELFI